MDKLKLQNRFNKKINQMPSGCWEWTKSKTRQGYGKFAMGDGKWMLAHRFSWLLFSGYLDNDKKILHHCDNPRCVNPDHLFEGTQKDNIKDMYLKKRRDSRGEKNPNSKLTLEDIQKIKILSVHKSYQELSLLYNVTSVMIGKIVTGKAWVL